MKKLTIRLDDRLYHWLVRLPERAGDSFASDVNETIVTALRCIEGELPIAHLVVVAARARGVSLAEATFGPCVDPVTADELLKAAERAAMGR